jgi:hypothetical protein
LRLSLAPARFIQLALCSSFLGSLWRHRCRSNRQLAHVQVFFFATKFSTYPYTSRSTSKNIFMASLSPR